MADRQRLLFLVASDVLVDRHRTGLARRPQDASAALTGEPDGQQQGVAAAVDLLHYLTLSGVWSLDTSLLFEHHDNLPAPRFRSSRLRSTAAESNQHHHEDAASPLTWPDTQLAVLR